MRSMANQVCDTSSSNFIGIFLYGSQNYQLSSDDSDTDTILLVYHSDKAKKEIEVEVGKIKVYTLKYFISRLKLGDLECYEILHTQHRYINPLYSDILSEFVRDFSRCMSYDRIKNSLYKKLNEHIDCMLWLVSSKDNSRYNKKRLYWAMRVCNQLIRILQDESFESSLIYRPLDEYDLMKIKNIQDHLSLRDFNKIYKQLITTSKPGTRYQIDVSEDEERCLSSLYNSITNIQGGCTS